MGNNNTKENCNQCNIEYLKFCNNIIQSSDKNSDIDDIIIFCNKENIHCEQCCTTFCPDCENHCCLCQKRYKKDINMIHCQKCHNEHNINYCCNCNSSYPNVENHCCGCKIWTNKNFEKHCCLCSCNHRLDFCCFCKKSWNIRLEEHCCKCQKIYLKNINHQCFIKSESSHSVHSLHSIYSYKSSEYDKISD
jgi:hypothetical protein